MRQSGMMGILHKVELCSHATDTKMADDAAALRRDNHPPLSVL